jgi:hypothetical protein
MLLGGTVNETPIWTKTFLGFPNGGTVGLAAIGEPNADINGDFLLAHLISPLPLILGKRRKSVTFCCSFFRAPAKALNQNVLENLAERGDSNPRYSF